MRRKREQVTTFIINRVSNGWVVQLTDITGEVLRCEVHTGNAGVLMPLQEEMEKQDDQS